MSPTPTSTFPRRALAVVVIGGAVAFGPASAGSAATGDPVRAAAMTMPMGDSMPEYVAAAYAALRRGYAESATADLQKAIAAKAEPKAARAHAREAIDALNRHDLAMAEMHAANGAAAEHLTYALQALNAGHLTGPMSATDHLGEAVALPRVHADAKAAIDAIKHHDTRAARHHILIALKTATSD